MKNVKVWDGEELPSRIISVLFPPGNLTIGCSLLPMHENLKRNKQKQIFWIKCLMLGTILMKKAMFNNTEV